MFRSQLERPIAVSVPDSLVLPRCVRRIDLALPAGPLAVLEGQPEDTVTATAVLVPGFTGSKEDFLPLLEPLAAAGVRVFAVDQRGQCDSPGLADPDGYSLKAFGDEIRAVLDLVADGGPIHLLGHSFGGHVVRSAVLGGGLTEQLRSVTLMCTGPAGAIDGPRTRTELFLSLSETLTLRQINKLEPVNRHPDAEVRAFLLRRWLANNPASLRAIAKCLLDEPDRTEELRAALADSSLPCLVVTGVDEDVWPAKLQQETAERLGAEFTAIPGAGHSPNAQQPEATTKALLNFWLR
jgi:pimeloyl-ACP methyl ester carboxylesterase